MTGVETPSVRAGSAIVIEAQQTVVALQHGFGVKAPGLLRAKTKLRRTIPHAIFVDGEAVIQLAHLLHAGLHALVGHGEDGRRHFGRVCDVAHDAFGLRRRRFRSFKRFWLGRLSGDV